MLLTLSGPPKTQSNIVAPKEFLEWAKEDLKSNNRRAIGNGLGNIKKAIHCRIDEILDGTHLKHCKGWNPRADTNTKLEALRLLNIKFTAVVSLLTDIRNKYEHVYKLPDCRQAQGSLDTAELWMDTSYDKYSFNKVAIVNLKATNFGVQHGKGGIKLTACDIDKSSNLDYLWNSKKEVHEIKNGKLTIRKMDTIDWKNMAQYEAKHLIFNGTSNKTQFPLPARLLTSVYKLGLKELIK